MMHNGTSEHSNICLLSLRFDSWSWCLVLSVFTNLENIMFIVSARPFTRSVSNTTKIPFEYTKLIKSHQADHMILENLSESETAQLSAACLQLTKIGAELAHEIYLKSSGNP